MSIINESTTATTTKNLANCGNGARELCDDIACVQCELNNARVILNCWITEYGDNNISLKTLQADDSVNGHLDTLLWIANYEEIERFVSIAQDYVIGTAKKLVELEKKAHKIFDELKIQ